MRKVGKERTKSTEMFHFMRSLANFYRKRYQINDTCIAHLSLFNFMSQDIQVSVTKENALHTERQRKIVLWK